MHPKHAAADHDILDLIRHRWSPRAFDSRPVSMVDLKRLFEAARWAPSSFNEQPWRFVVATREGTPEVFQAMADSLTGRNPLWATAAPVLVLVAVRRTIERNDQENRHAYYDTGHAVALLTLQATSMALSVRQMEGFDKLRARDACQMPEPFEPAVLMAVGYAGDPNALSYEGHRAAETKPRERRPVGDFTFAGVWGQRLE